MPTPRIDLAFAAGCFHSLAESACRDLADLVSQTVAGCPAEHRGAVRQILQRHLSATTAAIRQDAADTIAQLGTSPNDNQSLLTETTAAQGRESCDQDLCR